MNKYRVKFSKLGKIKFIGHLDLLKVFQRAIKRAKLPITYSKGFNPHQQVSFAIPLPLGMESISEYLDLKLDEDLDSNEILEKLNKEMPMGIEIINVLKLKDDEKNAPSIVCGGEYEVTLDREVNINDFNKRISDLLNSGAEINIQKKGKKRGKEILKTVNIRDEIYEISAIEPNKIKIYIATGSKKNLKPDILMEYIYNIFGFEYDKCKVFYKRTKLTRLKNNKLVPLDELE